MVKISYRTNTMDLRILLLLVTGFLLVPAILLAAILLRKSPSDTGNRVTNETTSRKNLVDTINATQLMFHLQQLQVIADRNNKTRALGSSGFKATMEYIEAQLRSKTNFRLFRQGFSVLQQNNTLSTLSSTINHTQQNYTDGIDFRKIRFSPAADFLLPIRLTGVPNAGCTDEDWRRATPFPATDSVVLVVRSQRCSVTEMSKAGQRYNIRGLLVYDKNKDFNNLPSLSIAQNVTYPAFVLTRKLGAYLVSATQGPRSTPARVQIFIPSEDIAEGAVSESKNLCVDTPTGSKTQTIVISSHADSVPDGAGINDNGTLFSSSRSKFAMNSLLSLIGSGAMAVLVLALNLARLFKTSSYEKYRYRVRFCWWGGEENGMLGSEYHLTEANLTSIEGNRLKDYLLMLNFDMLASPNYYFGIYESDSLSSSISPTVKHGSRRISQIFRAWFDKENLPWDNSSLSVLSDHLPFLMAGIACGGTFSGSDGLKTAELHDRYERMLGRGYGGIGGAPFDPCYHSACDTIDNINSFAYETMVRAAAHALETLARISDVRSWLHPSSSKTLPVV